MSRDELNASQLAELAALDRILAREPVGEEHLELAALVDSVRAGAPRIDADFAARLDERMLDRSSPERRRARAGQLWPQRPRLRRLAGAGGALVAAAVAFTIVISSGVLGGATHPPKNGLATGSTLRLPRSAAPATAKAAPSSGLGAAAGATATGPAAATSSTGALSRSPSAATYGPALHGRLVQQGSTLTLASAPAAMQGVADHIVGATESAGGVVETSSVNIAGPASYASFELQLPSGRLASLIGTLSSLASVRSLHQNARDITDGYDQEQARLADNVAEHAALLKQLAAATTLAQEAAIQARLNRVAARIAAEHAQIDRLLNEGHTATLHVEVIAGAGAKHTSAATPLSRAYHDALHALQEILAIALIALAILLPFALTAFVLWWGLTTVRQRARERAMRTA